MTIIPPPPPPQKNNALNLCPKKYTYLFPFVSIFRSHELKASTYYYAQNHWVSVPLNYFGITGFMDQLPISESLGFRTTCLFLNNWVSVPLTYSGITRFLYHLSISVSLGLWSFPSPGINHKPSDAECCTPSSEPFRLYSLIYLLLCSSREVLNNRTLINCDVCSKQFQNKQYISSFRDGFF
jgi:hypothetical protein